MTFLPSRQTDMQTCQHIWAQVYALSSGSDSGRHGSCNEGSLQHGPLVSARRGQAAPLPSSCHHQRGPHQHWEGRHVTPVRGFIPTVGIQGGEWKLRRQCQLPGMSKLHQADAHGRDGRLRSRGRSSAPGRVRHRSASPLDCCWVTRG